MDDQQNAVNEPITEEISENLTRLWYHNHTIAVVLSSDAARDKADEWADFLIDMIRNWPKDKPYLAVYDVSQSAVTPYTRKKSEEVSQAFIELKGEDYPAAYALVLSSSVVGHIMRMFAERELKSNYPDWEVKAFTDREKAIAWVKEMQPEMNARMKDYLEQTALDNSETDA